MRFSVYCLAFCFELELSQNTQNKSSEKRLYTKKIIIQLISANPFPNNLALFTS